MMRRAVVNERNERVPALQHLAVEPNRENATADAKRIVDADFVSGRAVAEDDLEAGSMPGNARVEPQVRALNPKSQWELQRHAIHPAGRTGVPGPSAAPHMRRLGINVRASGIGLDLVVRRWSSRRPPPKSCA